MPNWVEQDLHFVGARSEIDRFIRVGFVPGRKLDNLLHFRRLCALDRRDPKFTYTHDSGVVLSHFRTRTQAVFSFVTAWEYPAEFYVRLASHWPELSFICALNEEMSNFGGVIAVRDGKTTNLVRDYFPKYDRKRHAREVHALIKEWHGWLTEGRDWRLIPHHAWEHKSMPFDALFDDDFWFYFTNRTEIAHFKSRYKASYAMRRSGRRWVRARP